MYQHSQKRMRICAKNVKGNWQFFFVNEIEKAVEESK